MKLYQIKKKIVHVEARYTITIILIYIHYRLHCQTVGNKKLSRDLLKISKSSGVKKNSFL